VALGHTTISGTDTCDTVDGGCPAGVTSSATATVENSVAFEFTPKKH
jgi:hypothetical protein